MRSRVYRSHFTFSFYNKPIGSHIAGNNSQYIFACWCCALMMNNYFFTIKPFFPCKIGCDLFPVEERIKIIFPGMKYDGNTLILKFGK
jgi:hypothetical protein